ncbi:MAG: hypothetical protein GX982_07055 [Tissierellia bacterium]|nr:hypothetical protein [Tissierellia bacterium]
MFLAILLPIIGFLFLVVAFVYTKLAPKNKSKKNNNTQKDENNTKDLSELKEYIGLKDIKNSVIRLKNGGMRVVLSISSSDFELLTDEEQFNMENALIQFGLSLGHSIQFFTTPTRIEIKEPSKAIEELVNSNDATIPNSLKLYGNELLFSLKRIENERGTYVRRSFCVIGVDIEDETKAMNELNYRINTVASKLSMARMKINLLNSEQTSQLFADILQKGSNVLISKLIDDGVLELYSEGSGVIVFEEEF